MSNEGYIYCIYNTAFKIYGDNVYKLGRTKNLKSRMHGYTTSFVEPCKYELTSKKLSNAVTAEKLLFKKLSKCRVNSSREFFNCDLDTLTKIFAEIEDQVDGVGEKIVVKAVNEKKIINIDKPIHKKDNIKSNHSCTLCNKNYSSYQSLWIHNKKFHKLNEPIIENEKSKLQKKFTCNFCNHMFTSKNNMVVHIKEICKMAYKDKQEKTELENKLLELKKMVTKIKSRTNFNKDNIVELNIPLFEKPNNTSDNNVKSDYSCLLCNKDYSSYQSLWIHNKKYHKTKDNNTNTNIQSENKKVKSEKKFTCRFCNHMFTRKNNMVVHIKEKCKLADKDKYEKEELKNKVSELTKVVHQLQAETNSNIK